MSVLPPNVTALDLFERYRNIYLVLKIITDPIIHTRLVQQQYIAQSPATSVQTQDTGAIDSMES